VVVKPNVGPFKVDQKAQWFTLTGGQVLPAQEEATAG
jgi:hypothetical protein